MKKAYLSSAGIIDDSGGCLEWIFFKILPKYQNIHQKNVLKENEGDLYGVTIGKHYLFFFQIVPGEER